MTKLTNSEIKEYIDIAILFFDKAYSNGATYEQIKKDKESAVNKYLKFFDKNIDKGRDRYNSACNKARNSWFALETIEKIMEINKLDFVDDLSFCLDEKHIEHFAEHIQKDSYKSFLPSDDLSK